MNSAQSNAYVEQLLGVAEALAECIGSGYSSAESQAALWAYYRLKLEIQNAATAEQSDDQ